MLFRCEACPNCYCEDCLPPEAEIVGKCERFVECGQRHPDQACFVLCDAECVAWAQDCGEIAVGDHLGYRFAM